jgi:pimeloyl-ACP methyl ester carboxylesterase
MKSKFLTLLILLAILPSVLACGRNATPTHEATPTKQAPTVPIPTPTDKPTPEFVTTFQEAPCSLELPKGTGEGKDIVCGYVTVPQEHAKPHGKTIQLAVAVIPSTSDEPLPDPLLMLSGGPGESALTAFIPLLSLPGLERFWAKRDVVLVEQRGTMYSTPFLQCENMFKLKLEILGQNLGDEKEEALELQAWAACRDRFVASGVNLTAYNSLENAADIVAVADTLGYDQVNLYGGSYGSLLAQHIMRDYPERIRSVILSAVSPLRHKPNLLYKAHSMDRALRMLFARCETDAACNQAYPDLEEVYWNLVAQIDENPATLQIRNPETGEVHEMILTGDRLVSLTRNLLYVTAILPDLPGAIYDMVTGDFTLLELLESQFLFNLGLADGMYNSVVCTELADFYVTDMADAEGLYPRIAEVVEDLIDEVMLQPCQVWDVEHLDSDLIQSVVSDIPALLLSGELDPTVPPHLAEVAAEGLTNVYLYTLPGVSHSTLGTSECAHAMMLTFLDDPTQAPDASCIEEMPGLVFRIPTAGVELEPFVDEARGFSGLVPSGWRELQPANMARASSATDPAYFVLAAESGTAAEMFANLAEQLGLDPAAKPVAEAKVGSFTWDFYTFELQGHPVDLALAEDGEKAYFVLLVSPADEREVLYEQLFLPAVEAMASLESMSSS